MAMVVGGRFCLILEFEGSASNCEAHQAFIGFSISLRVVSSILLPSRCQLRLFCSMCSLLFWVGKGRISCHYYLSLFSSFYFLLPPSPTALAFFASFPIKFIHLLIIAVNHSSCNDFYEFLFMHRVAFCCRCRPYSSLLSIIISPTISCFFFQQQKQWDARRSRPKTAN